MATFYRDSNNGVIAVVTEETYLEIQKWEKLPNEAKAHVPYPGPIFTFTWAEHFGDEPWHTGTHELLDRLVRGHHVEPASGIYVPFSNSEMYSGTSQGSREALVRDMATLAQAMKAFHLLIPSELPEGEIA